MRNSYQDDWWNGVQALGWILFRAPETVDALGDGGSHLLLQMKDEAPHEVRAEFVSQFPQEGAMDALLKAMRAGQVRWTHSPANVEGTAGEASRLDIAPHHTHGLYAHAPFFGIHAAGDKSTERIGLMFRREDMLKHWPAEGGKSMAAPKSKGPRKGEVARFKADDMKLFPEIVRLMRERRLTVTAATRLLAEEDKVAGVGTPASRAKRLASLFRSEGGAGAE